MSDVMASLLRVRRKIVSDRAFWRSLLLQAEREDRSVEPDHAGRWYALGDALRVVDDEIARLKAKPKPSVNPRRSGGSGR